MSVNCPSSQHRNGYPPALEVCGPCVFVWPSMGHGQLVSAGHRAEGKYTIFHFLCTHHTSEKLLSFSRHIFPSCAGPWWAGVGLNKMEVVRAAGFSRGSAPSITLHSQDVSVLCEEVDFSLCPGLCPSDGPQRKRPDGSCSFTYSIPENPRCHSNDCKKHCYFTY